MKVNKQLVAILILAIVFRFVLMRWRFAIGFDEPHYLQLGAAAVLFGWENLLHPYWSPMYPALIGLMSVFSHNFELIGRLVNVLSGSAVIIPVYVLTRELFGKTTGILAAFLLAFFPALAFNSTNTLSESTYTLLSISGITFGWFALKGHSVWKGAMAGAFFGMSYLTKPEGLGYLFVFLFTACVWLFYHWRRHRKLTLVKIMVITSGITVLFALPYIIYLKQTTLEWTISGKYKVNRFDVNAINRLSPDNRESPLDMAYHSGTFHRYDINMYAGSDGHVRDLISLAKGMAKNVYKILRFSIPGVITGPMFFLMALGLVANPWTWSQAKLTIYLLTFIVFFWLIVISFFHINDRYLAPLLPLCFAWIAQGTTILSKRMGQIFSLVPVERFIRSSANWGKVMTIAVLIVLSFLPEIGKVIGRDRLSHDFWVDAVELKEAGYWLKKNTNHTPVLMSYNKAVDFYSGQYDIRKTATFSQDSVDRILKYAAHRGVNYIVIDERYQDEFPNLVSLIHGQNVPNELKRVYDYVYDSGFRVVIYELRLE